MPHLGTKQKNLPRAAQATVKTEATIQRFQNNLLGSPYSTEAVRKNLTSLYQMQLGSCMSCLDAKYHLQNTSWIEKYMWNCV